MGALNAGMGHLHRHPTPPASARFDIIVNCAARLRAQLLC
jgi:hypothetical protein